MSRRPLPADFPEIGSLFSGYFHQDWMMDGTVEEVLDRALEDYPDNERAALLAELTSLLAKAEDDSVLKAVFNGFPHSEIGFQRAKDAGDFARMLHRKLAGAAADSPRRT